MRVAVLTVDQRGSRATSDLVPDTLARLDPVPTLLTLERTAGDEFQGVLDDPTALPTVLEPLLRAQVWTVGIGVGDIEEPLPSSARAGRGTAYLHAREAVNAAKTSPWHVEVRGDTPTARALESALWLWAVLLARRTPRGWEVADLLDAGSSYDEAAQRLGITQSAVSQRARAAAIVEGRRGRELVAHLAERVLTEPGVRT